MKSHLTFLPTYLFNKYIYHVKCNNEIELFANGFIFYYISFTLFYNVKIPIMYVYELYVVHDKLAIKLLYIELIMIWLSVDILHHTMTSRFHLTWNLLGRPKIAF